MIWHTPLEQFEVRPLQPLSFLGLCDLSYTNTAHASLTAVLAVSALLALALFPAKVLPSAWQSVAEMLYLFVLDMVKQQAGPRALPYFPLLFTAFLFVLSANLVGLVPENFTATSHLATTFTLSLGFNLGFLILGFVLYGLGYLWFFVPSGTPRGLLPLIVVIEVVSYALRPFSLAIRLFANMMAGHTLLYILASFVLALGHSSHLVLALVPFLLVGAVFCLEFGIAFLQAYVFAILLTIYLNDALSLHH